MVAVLLGPLVTLLVPVLTSATGHADTFMFIMCPSGRDGIASPVTSCPFADMVRLAYLTQPGNVVTAYSPVTDEDYEMTCHPITAHFTNGMTVDAQECEGGNDADVVVW
ncbi:hypothetical protein A5682_08915 [Mycobacterium mantenii]|nr:hypothetical protein A5682_08915 [Mycobacterium mantenii]